uniref:Glycosyl hydrolase family 13 catalytic domain-containing protein n=1 Tax=Sphaeramia orbicularis TaxID=375764 RepID=A0A673B1A5_9TELE
KGLLVGPVHVAPPDDAMNLSFEEFKGLVQAAHKKGISVVLDLTPNYLGSSGPWFSNVTVTSVAERLKSALVFWLSEGVDGVQLGGVERVATVVPSLWTDIRTIVQNWTDHRPHKRVDLLLSRVLRADTTERAQSVQRLYYDPQSDNLLWSLEGGPRVTWPQWAGPLWFNVPAAAVDAAGDGGLHYGDEIGLKDEVRTGLDRMLWDSDEELNGTLQTVSELRVKERSLLFGDFVLLFNSSSSLAYLRVWDQSQRYLAAFNWLPRWATVVVSTNSSALPANAHVELTALRLEAGHAALLKFPY